MPTVQIPRQLRRSRPVVEDLEAALVRRSVDALALDRPSCADCHRTPLIGEYVYLYELQKEREELLCALCRPRREAAPDRTLLVQPEAGRAVRAFRS